MLDICYSSGTKIDISFNAKTSSLFVVGKCYDVIVEDLKIDHDTILWSNRLEYTGVYFKSGRNLLVDNETTIRKF